VDLFFDLLRERVQKRKARVDEAGWAPLTPKKTTSVRMDPTMLGVCNDEASQAHPLYKDFQTTYCKPGTSDAVRMPFELAGPLAQTLNDGLVFRSGAFYDGPTLRQRVFPNPHWQELASVCAGESAGTLADWCRAFLADKASHEKKALLFLPARRNQQPWPSVSRRSMGFRGRFER
jgi:hypothetical protein